MDRNQEAPVRDIIVIGGSQGSVEVLRTVLAELPEHFPAAILIVIHAPLSSLGDVAAILDRYTPLPVAYAGDGDRIEPGRVYLAPPDRHLEIVEPGNIRLSDGPRVRNSRPAADRLFTTAARVFGSRVISLILSGGDCDGSDGANAIVDAAGISFIQAPADALVASMPIHAIRTDHPSAILTTRSMGLALMDAVSASSG
jgi:two-component system chemotaxis response regulator CheB